MLVVNPARLLAPALTGHGAREPHDPAHVDRDGVPERDPDRQAARLRGGGVRRRRDLRARPRRLVVEPGRDHRPGPSPRPDARPLPAVPRRRGGDRGRLHVGPHRARSKFQLMQRLGIDTMLVCSNVGTATVDDDEVSASQLRRLGDVAEQHGVRLAFEALAWGRFIDDYRRAWRIVELADHPAVGVCLDSFHILSRGHDPAQIEQIPGDKIFFLQLADAPALTMDVLSWSRHHRLFPGEGAFDLPQFVGHCLAAGYSGPMSLEVFNDTFRQTDVLRTAQQAKRSLTWLEDQVAQVPSEASRPDRPSPSPTSTSPWPSTSSRSRPRTPVTSTCCCGSSGSPSGAATAASRSGSGPRAGRGWSATSSRPESWRPPWPRSGSRSSTRRPRPSGPGGSTPRRCSGVPMPMTPTCRPSGHPTAPRSSWPIARADAGWVTEFEGGDEVPPDPLLTGIDHVNLAHPWQSFDEAVLFYSSVLALESGTSQDVAAPTGLVRSHVVRSGDGAVRLALTSLPRRSTIRTVSRSTWRSPPTTPSPRRGPPGCAAPSATHPGQLLRRPGRPLRPRRRPGRGAAGAGSPYDRDGDGDFTHFYTETVGGVFLEVVQRRGGYQGYGATNAVRLAASMRPTPATDRIPVDWTRATLPT